ncbi:MAG: hypothetical protein NTX53_09810 [candidate division WOR-3 bacterium]|nr:hypothetical protein [candidate division WOR-3 bacterium]
MNGLSLPTLPKYARVTITFFLLLIGLTYLVGVLNIYNKTKFTVQGAIENERGSEEKMIYAKEFGDMVSLTHFHLGGWAMMFMWVLLFFLFSTYSPKLKGLLGVLPFVLAPLDAGSMWLTRYAAPGFAYLLMAVGFLMAAIFGLVLVLDLINLWWGRKPVPQPA